jgi:rhodanese-related sulfurtransferase
VLCASGYRAATATSVLAAAEFVDVSILLGGVDAWRTAGLWLHSPDRSPQRTTTMTEPFENLIPEIGPEEAEELTDALLLDVREADEWAAGHAPTATWIPMGELQARIAELPPDRKILAICRSGGRSAAVTEALNGAGFDAVNVAGGMQSWARAGLDVVADDGAAGTII